MALFDDELRRLQSIRAQLDARDEAEQAAIDYENKARAAQEAQAQQKQGGLGGVLAGIGESIGNLGNSLYNMFGTGAASIRDLVTGNAGTNKYQNEWKDYMKKSQYGDENMSDKDYYLKTGGKSLDAAATASDFIPGLGVGAKVALNVGQGAASGVAQNLIDKGANVSGEDMLKGAIAGAGAAGVGQLVGNKLAKGVGGNGRIAKAINSNLGRGALTGAASGATGAGLQTMLNGGDLGQTLSGALQGASGGALGGATMAGVMGLAGTGIDKLNSKIVPNDVQTIPEAPTAATKRVIETESTPTRKGIAITDYDAGEQPIAVKRAGQPSGEYSLGKNAGSTLDGILGPNNKRKLPNAAQQTDAQLLKNLTGEYDNAASIYGREYEPKQALAELKDILAPEKYNELVDNIRNVADMNQLSFDGLLSSSKSDLPVLNRQQYYEDTIGKLRRTDAFGNEIVNSAKDVPDYMNSHLRNDTTGQLNGQTLDNGKILRELFRGQMGDAVDTADLGDLYSRYEALAQNANANEIFTPENIESAIRMTGNDDITKALVDKYNLRQNIDVDQYPSLNKPVEVGVETPLSNETVYTKRILNPQTAQEMPVARQISTPEQETPLIQKGTQEYNDFVRKENIANRQRELRRDIVNGIRDQYGTTRLNDRINGLNDAIMEVADLGLTKRSQIDGFANRITGRDGEVPRVIRKSLKNGGDVNGRIDLSMEDVYRKVGAGEGAQQQIKSFFEDTGRKYSVDQNGNMNRLDMYDFGKELEREAYKQIDRGERLQNNQTERYGQGLRILAEEYLNKATDGVDVKSNINVNKLKNILPGNDKWASKVDNLVNNAETVQDLRSFIEAPTKMSLLAQAEEYNQGTYGQRGGDLGRDAGRAFRAGTSANPAVALGQIALEKAIDSDAGQQARINRALKNYQNIEAGGTGKTGAINTVKNVAGAIGDKIGNVAKNLNNTTVLDREISPITKTIRDNNTGAVTGVATNTIGDLATRQIARQSGLAAANDVNLEQEQANAQNALVDAQNAYNTAIGNYQNAAAQAQAAERQTSQGAQQLQNISNAMDAALAAGDITSYSKLADLYQQAYKIYGADLEQNKSTSTAKSLSANQSKALAAQQQLEQLATMTPDAGTAMADIPILSNIIGLTGGNEYANQAKALATTLGYLLSGANIKESEAERIGQSYVPNAYDSEAVRQQKLARARQLIQSYMGSTDDLTQA